MVRPNDPFWGYVEEMNDGSLKCKFCGSMFAVSTSISRIKFHLSREEGHGIKICTKVTADVQQSAYQAIQSSNRKRKSIPSSSNNAVSASTLEQNIEVRDTEMMQQGQPLCNNAVINAVSASTLEQDSEVRDVEVTQQGQPLSPGGLAWMDSLIGEMDFTDGHNFPGESMVDAPETRPGTECAEQEYERNTGGISSSLAKDDVSRNNMQSISAHSMPTVEGCSSTARFIANAHETRGDVSETADLLYQASERDQNQFRSSSVMNHLSINRTLNISRGSMRSTLGSSLLNVSPGCASETRYPFLTTKLVGGEFEKNKNAVWSWLTNDEISSIGIYGMRGVGKTTLLTHIYNMLLERPSSFCYVSWITVSQDFSINKLQNLIAKDMLVDLSSEDDERKRAARLSKALVTKQKWVLLFDDVWNQFPLEKVGIPAGVNGCKLILTTRSLNICRWMGCQKKIKVEPLSEKEAWTLFFEKLGHDVALSPEVEQIAKSVARECAGLPLGIITMAGSMRGVDDACEWRNVVEELKESKVRQDDMEPEVFRILRFSYNCLNDSALQQCLLYCSLFPKASNIKRKDLIGYLIDEGIIEGMKSRQAEFDKGHAILNKLENVCLLVSCQDFYGDSCVKMHDLIRDMALQIQRLNSSVMIEAGAQLKELPDLEKWTEDLTRVSLIANNIEKIPSSHSPRCPNISTLFLSQNYQLTFISESFLKQLLRLNILDLSHTSIDKLLDSISDMVSLTALLLGRCDNLRHVPSLRNLRDLKRLDLGFTALQNVPQGMEWLFKVRYLNLHGSRLQEFPTEVLPNLPHLQVLIQEKVEIQDTYRQIGTLATVKGKEVARLRKLETLQCLFKHLFDFRDYLESREESQALTTYSFIIGTLNSYELSKIRNSCFPPMYMRKRVWLGNCNIYGEQDIPAFPNDIQELVILRCIGAKSLCDVSSLAYAAGLEYIYLSYCKEMESLLSSSWFSSAPPPLPSKSIFSCLKTFVCVKCRSMKKLFPLGLIPNLQNLEQIAVHNCDKLLEIIAKEDEKRILGEETSSSSNHYVELSLPKLRCLDLRYLPKLENICRGKMIADSLQKIRVWNCLKLKRMPLSLPLLGSGQPSPPPSLEEISVFPRVWWDSVEWDHPHAKDVLLPVADFLSGPYAISPRTQRMDG